MSKELQKYLKKIPSRDHTEIMLKYFGASLNVSNNCITLKSPNFLKPKDLEIPGDFSSAAFIIVAVLLSQNSKVKIRNVGLNFYRIGFVSSQENGCKISITKKKL